MKNKFLFILLFLFSISSFSQLTQFNDSVYYFSFDYPENWTITNEMDTNLRAIIKSDDDKYTLVVYGFFLLTGDIDLEKIVAQDTVFFSRLGSTSYYEEDRMIPYIGKYLGYVLSDADHINYIRKKYDKNANGYYAYAHFEVLKHYAYILIAYSEEPDFEVIEPIFESLDISVPMLKNIKNNFSWEAWKKNVSWESIKKKLPGLLIWILYFLWMLSTMYCGRYYKRGRDKKRELRNFRDNLEDGYVITDTWVKKYNKAKRTIFFSILGLIITILIAIPVFGSNILWAILLMPIFFIGGYFGYLIKPSED